MEAQNAPAALFCGATAIIPKGKASPKLSDVQVFSEEGNALPQTHYFADKNDKGELTLTLADEMPKGVYLVYMGKLQSLAKIKKA